MSTGNDISKIQVIKKEENFRHKAILNIYIVFEINLWSQYGADSKLENYLELFS